MRNDDKKNNTDLALDRMVQLVHQYTGITIAIEKKRLLEGRLRSRLRETGVSDYADYIQLVTNDKKEREIFINAVTTNETYFFRTPRIWSYICEDFLVNWKAKNPGKVFRAWSAAASTGEEVYTLAIFLTEFKNRHRDFNFELLATDISTEVLEKCEKANYSGRSVKKFFEAYPEHSKNHFTKSTDDVFTVNRSIRSKVKFKQHNLFNDLAVPSRFDLILLRNVMIYFVKNDQAKVISKIQSKLAPEGRLIIGESETLNNIETKFVSQQPFVYEFKKSAA